MALDVRYSCYCLFALVASSNVKWVKRVQAGLFPSMLMMYALHFRAQWHQAVLVAPVGPLLQLFTDPTFQVRPHAPPAAAAAAGLECSCNAPTWLHPACLQLATPTRIFQAYNCRQARRCLATVARFHRSGPAPEHRRYRSGPRGPTPCLSPFISLSLPFSLWPLSLCGPWLAGAHPRAACGGEPRATLHERPAACPGGGGGHGRGCGCGGRCGGRLSRLEGSRLESSSGGGAPRRKGRRNSGPEEESGGDKGGCVHLSNGASHRRR